MTEPRPEGPPETVPSPAPGSSSPPDLGTISTEPELRAAVLALLGNSYDRAVENRTGLSKTTVNDLRNGRRRLTLKTLTVIVSTYDSQRTEAWLAVWHNVRASGSSASPVARDGAATGGPADHLGSADSAVAGGAADASDQAHQAHQAHQVRQARQDGAGGDSPRIRQPAGSAPPRPDRVRSRARWLAAGSALVAAAATAAMVVLVLSNGNVGVLSANGADASPTLASDVGAVGPPGPVPGLPPYGPGGPGAAAPVGGPGPPLAGVVPRTAGSGSGSAVPPGCYSMSLPVAADVVDQPGAASSGVRLTEAFYHYFEAWSPSAAVGGQLSGRPSEDRVVVGAAWADPDSVDSTAERSPGNGRFYPGNALELSEQNCFTVAPYNIGYGGYSGITTRIYVLTTDAPTAGDLPRQAHQLAGLTQADLDRLGIDVVGYFVVPSPARPGD